MVKKKLPVGTEHYEYSSCRNVKVKVGNGCNGAFRAKSEAFIGLAEVTDGDRHI